jgi:hypothetical protein
MVSHPLSHQQTTAARRRAPWIYYWARYSFMAELVFLLAMLPVAWMMDMIGLWVLGMLVGGPPRLVTWVYLSEAGAVYAARSIE